MGAATVRQATRESPAPQALLPTKSDRLGPAGDRQAGTAGLRCPALLPELVRVWHARQLPWDAHLSSCKKALPK